MCKSGIFKVHHNAHIASAVLAIAIPSVHPSVCLSVHLSRSGIVSKRLETNRQTDRQTNRHYENNGHLAMNQKNAKADMVHKSCKMILYTPHSCITGRPLFGMQKSV